MLIGIDGQTPALHTAHTDLGGVKVIISTISEYKLLSPRPLASSDTHTNVNSQTSIAVATGSVAILSFVPKSQSVTLCSTIYPSVSIHFASHSVLNPGSPMLCMRLIWILGLGSWLDKFLS